MYKNHLSIWHPANNKQKYAEPLNVQHILVIDTDLN